MNLRFGETSAPNCGNQDGRKVYLAVGRAGRTPRRYRGKDANWWHDKLGHYDKMVSELPSPKAKFAGKPIISGTRGGHTLKLHQLPATASRWSAASVASAMAKSNSPPTT